MDRKNVGLKILSFITCIFLIASFMIPAVVQASSITDSAKKTVLKTLEDIEKNIDENKYPGYKEKLIALKKANPNWKFTLYYTNLNWETVIQNETKGLHSRSLVQGKTGEWLCEVCGTKVYDAGGWMCASEKAVSYLMDVRNYLTQSYIFQFEALSYNPDTYTIEGIEKVLNGTFMYKKNIREYYNNSKFANITFADAIMEAANTSGVSPYYLAARIRQEVGVNGSNSVYGTYKGYEGYYNFYNIGATSGTDPIANGLKYASNKSEGKYLLPWNDPVKAIKGGAIWIAANYIAVGQDTLYFQKFDVVRNGSSLYTHQYMQNIFAAKNEGYTTYTTYNKLGLLDNNYNFIIPVYENMPKTLSAEPKNTVTTEQVKVTENNVMLREMPTSSSTRLAILKKDTVLTRLEKKAGTNNGFDWDKVKLANGTIGFIQTNYLAVVKSGATNSGSSSSTGEKVKVNASNVNVRKSATTSSSKITTLAKNTVVTRLQKKVAYKNGYYWDKIQLSNGKIGYMATNYLTAVTSTSSSSSSSSSGEKVKINASRVNVRKSATTSSSVLSTLNKNTVLTRLQKNVAYKNGYYWDKVKLSNGKTGYVASKYLSKC